MRHEWIRTSLVVLLVTAPAAAHGGQDASATDIDQGKAIFGGACVVCHGIGGGGAMAPQLNQPWLQSAPDDTTLQMVIEEGIPARGMPRVQHVTDNQLRQLTAYIRSLARTAPGPITGNAKAGAAVYKTGWAARRATSRKERVEVSARSSRISDSPVARSICARPSSSPGPPCQEAP